MIALVGCVLLLPVFLIIALVLSIANRGTPFFLQVRPGKNEKLFKIIKFKTMSDAKDKEGILLPDDQRLTFIGKIVRKTSLDEIPQLINVLKGEMSLIGPRPLLPDYLNLYNNFQRKRHTVKPGMTGLAAIRGRNTLDWNEKFRLDVWYVENLSFSLDLEIIFKTFKKVILSEGVSPEGQTIMPRFSEYVKQRKNS